MATGWERHLADFDDDCLGVVVLGADFTIRAVSDGVLRISGHDRDELLARSGLELLHPDDLERGATALEETSQVLGSRSPGMYRLRFKDGTFHQFAMVANNLGPDHDGALVFQFHEADARVRAEAFAEDVVDVMRIVAEEFSIEDCLDWVMRVGERHVEGMQLVITALGDDGTTCYSRGHLPEAIRAANAAASADRLPAHVEAAAVHHRQRPWRAVKRVALADDTHPGRLTSVIGDRSGQVIGYVEALRPTGAEPSESEWLVHGLIARVITAVLERHALDQRFRYAADHDDLTGLVNRRSLLQRMGDRTDLAGSQLFLIDLDRFSWINNTLGHQVGDTALQKTAEHLIEACPEHAVVARLGGDEFVVWVPAIEAGNLEQLGEALRAALVVPVDNGDRRVLLRSSIGMVEIAEGEAASAAISRADEAMYVSKRKGGDTITRG